MPLQIQDVANAERRIVPADILAARDIGYSIGLSLVRARRT